MSEMKVLLLMPPTDLDASYGRLKRFSNARPSIGLAYIAAVLLKNNIKVKVIDAYLMQSSLNEIMAEIHRFMPDIIGISVLTSSADTVYGISRQLKKTFPKIKIVMGNLHASIFAEEILSNNLADFIVHHEGEYTMLELVQALQREVGFHGIKGLTFKNGERIIHNEPRPLIRDLDKLPFPAWELFPLETYPVDPRIKVKDSVPEALILASRGCPNQCTFCSSRTQRSQGMTYRMRDPKSVVDEMVDCNERFGNTVFSFMDLAFPLVREHAMSICDEIISRNKGNKFKWFTECRVKPLDAQLLTRMRKAGCIRISLGIESGNNRILRLLKKNFTTDDVKSAVRMAHDAQIDVDGMFMLGLPEENEETMNETIDLANQLILRYAIFNIFVPYPGCDLFDVLKVQNKINYKSWSDFTSYPRSEGGKPVYLPDGISISKLLRMQRKAMLKFYTRPRFIFQELKRLNIGNIGYYFDGLRYMLFDR